MNELSKALLRGGLDRTALPSNLELEIEVEVRQLIRNPNSSEHNSRGDKKNRKKKTKSKTKKKRNFADAVVCSLTCMHDFPHVPHAPFFACMSPDDVSPYFYRVCSP